MRTGLVCGASPGGEAVGCGAEDHETELRLTTDLRLGFERGRARARSTLREGERAFVALSWTEHAPPADYDEAHRRMSFTADFWHDWLAHGDFPDHPWRQYLQRSALTLKGLTYAPTGAMCAASVFSARAAAQRADAAGSISSAVQGPRCPASCQTSETMPHPLHRSSARSFLRGCAKRASSSASVPNVAPGAVSTRVPLSRISTPIQTFARSCAYFSSATWVLLSLIVPSITSPRASSNGILTTSRNSPASRCCAVLCRPVAAHR